MNGLAEQAALAEDRQLRSRVAACVAGIDPSVENPLGWASTEAWRVAVTPGWAGAERITDDMIRDRVLVLLGRKEPDPVETEPGSAVVLYDQTSSIDTGTPS